MSRSKKKNGLANTQNGQNPPVPGNATVKNSTALNNKSVSAYEFRHFLKHASIPAIRRFLSLASTTSDGANLQLFWDRAFSEGKQTRSEDNYQRGYSDGYDSGHSDGYESAFNEAADELFPEDADDKDYVPDTDSLSSLCLRAMVAPARTPLGALWHRASDQGRLEGFEEGKSQGIEEGKKDGGQQRYMEGFDAGMDAGKIIGANEEQGRATLEAVKTVHISIAAQTDEIGGEPPTSPTRINASVQAEPWVFPQTHRVDAKAQVEKTMLVSSPLVQYVNAAIQVEQPLQLAGQCNCLDTTTQVTDTTPVATSTADAAAQIEGPIHNKAWRSTVDWAEDDEGLSFDPLFPVPSLPVGSDMPSLPQHELLTHSTKKAPVAFWGDIKAVWDCAPLDTVKQNTEEKLDAPAVLTAKTEVAETQDNMPPAVEEDNDDDDSVIIIAETPSLSSNFLSPSRKPLSAKHISDSSTSFIAPLVPPGLGLESPLQSSHSSNPSKLSTKALAALPKVYAQDKQASLQQPSPYEDSKALKGWVKEQLDSRKGWTTSKPYPKDSESVIPLATSSGDSDDEGNSIDYGSSSILPEECVGNTRPIYVRGASAKVPSRGNKKLTEAGNMSGEDVTSSAPLIGLPPSPSHSLAYRRRYSLPNFLGVSVHKDDHLEALTSSRPTISSSASAPMIHKELHVPQEHIARPRLSTTEASLAPIVNARLLADQSVSNLNIRPQRRIFSDLHRSSSGPTPFSSLQYRSKRFKIRNCACQRYRTRGGASAGKPFDESFPHPAQVEREKRTSQLSPHGNARRDLDSVVHSDLNWENDPRLADLSRCLRSLGWVRGCD